MNECDARLKLADELMALADELRDPDSGVGIMSQFGKTRELKVEALLGNNKTLIAIREWTEEEVDYLSRQSENTIDDDEWPDILI